MRNDLGGIIMGTLFFKRGLGHSESQRTKLGQLGSSPRWPT